MKLHINHFFERCFVCSNFVRVKIIFMKKRVSNHPLIVYKSYQKYQRKYFKLLQSGKRDTDKMNFLRKRIFRLKSYLECIVLRFKLVTAIGATSFFLFTSNSGKGQTFIAPVTNPFGLTDIGEQSIPNFADLDSDGDLDMMTGERYGDFKYFKNNGSISAPLFGAPAINPFGLANLGYASCPVFVDLDNDGDMDIMSGEQFGNFKYFQNVGTASVPSFTTLVTNPFGLSDIGFASKVSFADLDFDGDLDLLAGEKTGNWKYFQNIGTATSPSFSAPVSNPFGLVDVGYGYSSPAFVDLDFDGDMDLVSGEYYGDFKYFQNTGTHISPSFATMTPNPFGLIVPGIITNPAFADLDNDGDYDVIVGMITGIFKFHENVCASSALGNIGSIVGPSSICANSSNSYSVSLVSGALSYKWMIPASWSGSSVTNTISITSSTNSGPIEAIAINGCKGRISKKDVIVAPLPSISVVSNPSTICAGQSATLTASGGSTYNWSTGATTPDIIVSPTTTTMYTVTGTSSKGCSNNKVYSLIVESCTTLNEGELKLVNIYPNPTNGILHIDFPGYSDEVAVMVINSLGELIFDKKVSKEETVIDLNELISGVYFVKISLNEEQKMIRIVKE